MAYDAKLTGVFDAATGDKGDLIVEQTQDGKPYRKYVLHYDTFKMPSIPGVPPIDSKATILRSVAWVRQAMIDSGHPDEDADPMIAKFSGLDFKALVSFDQFLSWMTAQLQALGVAIARTQGLDWGKLNAVWQAAGQKV